MEPLKVLLGICVAICVLVAFVLLVEKVNEIDQHVNGFIGGRVNALEEANNAPK